MPTNRSTDEAAPGEADLSTIDRPKLTVYHGIVGETRIYSVIESAYTVDLPTTILYND